MKFPDISQHSLFYTYGKNTHFAIYNDCIKGKCYTRFVLSRKDDFDEVSTIKCEVGVQSMVSAKRRGFVGGSSVSNKAKVAFTCVLVVLFYALLRTPEKKVMGVTSTKPVVKDDIMFDSLWKYSAKDIEGNDLSLSTFKGR